MVIWTFISQPKQGACRVLGPNNLQAERKTGMAGVLDSVNQRTQLVGQNRLELLLFRLEGEQLYGINVFKVREVLQCPRLTVMPKCGRVVRGVASIRGSTLPILDLSLATGKSALMDFFRCHHRVQQQNAGFPGELG